VNALWEIGVEILTGRGLALPAAAFVVVGCLVFVAASRLAKRADEIADATGLGRVWIGSVLLAASTSLPELTTDVNAAMLGAIDIGVGDLFGSTLANMLVLATLDIFYARRRLLHQVAMDHTLVGALAIVLTAIATIAIATRGLPAVGPIGLDSVLIAAMYLFGMHAVYRSIGVPSSPPAQLELGATRKGLLLRGLRGFAFGTIGLLVAAPLLVVTAEAIALESGQTQTMVGTALVWFTTSFPEIAATIAAARMGAFDLAVGNIFGSNAFNICIFLAMDVAYSGAPVLSVASLDHVLTGQIAVLTIALGVMGILARAQRRIAVVRVESLLVVAANVGAVWLLMTPAGAR
jgi:cation:H+ antiporter